MRSSPLAVGHKLGLYTFVYKLRNYNSPYLSYSLDHADSAIQVVDYHTYANDPAPTLSSVQATIAAHNPDGVTEPIWVSEWGALWSSYNTLARALLTAEQLLTFAEGDVEGVTIFNLYDWSTAPGQDYGLIDLQDDGLGGVNRVPTETYYAYRLLIRGLKDGKDRLAFTSSGLGMSGYALVTRDANNLYIIVKDGDGTVDVDISAVSGYDGIATIYEYSTANKDVVVATPAVSSGQLSFVAPASGLSLVQVPAQPNAVSIRAFAAGDSRGWISQGWRVSTLLLVAFLAAWCSIYWVMHHDRP